MKHNAFTLVELLIVIAIIAVLAAFLWPVNNRNPENAPRSSCASNLKQINLGYLQYAQDYNEKFPITTTQQGIVGALQPYLKSEAIFRCPSEAGRGADNLTDYWFNRRLAGIELKKVETPASTFLNGDGEASDDPNLSLILLPPQWVNKSDSPAWRHLEGANYGFADGHVKWLKASYFDAPQAAVGAPTFLPR